MKIRSFQIQNYKCLKNVKQDNCGNFHALIGSNSSGKSSVFEAIKLFKMIFNALESDELVYGGIKEYENKIIKINLQLEIPNNLRENYFFHYLNLDEESTKLCLETPALSSIDLGIEILVFGTKIPDRNFHRLIFLNHLEFPLEDNSTIILVSRNENNTISFRRVDSRNQKISLRGTSLTNYLGGIGPTTLQPNDSQVISPNNFIGAIFRDLQQSLRDIQPIRESSKITRYQYVSEETQIGLRGEQLTNFMDTMYTNDRERYFEVEKYCKAIFPNIEKIRPDKLPNEQIRIVVTKKNLPYTISMSSEGRGLDQLLIVIWKIATAPKETIWLLDEPEIHLHPGAEKLLYDFLIDETKRDKQIIVATHSMVFIHKSKENEISILLNKDGSTELASLENLIEAEGKDPSLTNDQIREKVYHALGYDATFAFEPITVVVVEGKTDEKVFQIFSKIIDKPINLRSTKFIPVGDKRQAKQFSPILTYAASNKNILIILDNDKEKPEQIKQKILQREKAYREKIGVSHQLLSDDNFGVYREEAYSIEFYLLDPKSIVKVVNAPDKVEQIRNQIKTELAKPLAEQMRPKDLLKQIWSDNGFGPYNETDTPIKIAENTSKDYLLQFPEIVQIIEKING